LEGGVVLYFCVPRTYFEQKPMLRNYVESPLGPALRRCGLNPWRKGKS
jgi:hypothetical protein